MAGLTAFLNWKVALIWHTIFFSFAMLQEMPILGMLWLVINTFVFILLLRAVYGPADDKHSNRGMAWYFYTLSIFTDFLSLCIFGQHIVNEKQFLAVFVLVMAVFILIPKPIFAYFLLKSLQNDGFDFKKGINMRKSTMMDGGDNYQGFTGLDDQQQYVDQGYNNPPQQQQAEADVVVVPSQPQQQPAISPASGAQNDGPNQSLMDSVGQHDVFSPGQ